MTNRLRQGPVWRELGGNAYLRPWTREQRSLLSSVFISVLAALILRIATSNIKQLAKERTMVTFSLRAAIPNISSIKLFQRTELYVY